MMIIISSDARPQWVFTADVQGIPRVFSVNESTGYAVCWPHGIYKTSNGGDNWIHQTGMTSPHAISCYFISPDTGWVVGVYGTFWKTTNGGESWLDRTVDGTFRYAIYFATPETGWAVGIPGIITKTTDGGDTWFEQTNPATWYLNDVEFTDALTGWVVGHVPFQTVILKTTNGGNNWVEQFAGRNASAQSVCFIDASTGWIAGVWNLYLKTTDGGNTWNSRTLGNNNMGIHFLNASTGWMVGDDGAVLSTKDGGNSWNREVISDYGLQSVHFSTDGYGLVGAYTNPSNYFTGKIYKFSPALPILPNQVFTGEFESDRFGTPANPAGDVNGDGFDDVIIGAPSYDHSGTFGRSYIFNGSSSPDNIADVILPLKGVNGLEFPWIRSVCRAGDVNGDGFSDVIVQSRSNSGVSEFGAEIYHGSSNMNNVPDLTINGFDQYGVFGVSVADAGDVNGDGFSDVIVGDPGDLEDIVYQLFGKAFIFFGGPGMDNVPDITMYGEHWRSNFGFSVSPAGDFNGDGFDDVIVGSPFWGESGSYDVGKTYVFYGGRNMDNIPDVTMTGYVPNNFFGYAASTAGDVNNDGYSDVIVGSSELGDKAYMFFGGANPDNTPDLIFDEAPQNDSYDMVFMNDDFDGDGYSDVIVGTPHFNNNTGKAYIYRGGENMDIFADFTMTGEEAGSKFGSWVSTAGDVNDDGYSDIIVSAPWYQNRKGRAYLFFGFGEAERTLSALSITPENIVKQIGEQAEVTGSINNKLGQPMNNVRINFFVRGANRAYGSGMSNGSGNVIYQYSADYPGFDTIIAVSGKFRDTSIVFWEPGNSCIAGPIHVPVNSISLYYTETSLNAFYDLSNFDNTNARIISGNENDSVYVDAGSNHGHFVLYLATPDSIICSKHVYVDSPYPVELTAFNSNIIGKDITLTWSTSAELNNSGFEIQRAIENGNLKIENWSKIGFVSGSGTTNEPKEYSYTDRNLETGKYKYRLKQLDFNGNFEYFELSEVVSIGIPDKYDLSQNYPNPFNPVTTINYDLPNDGIVTIKVYDIIGREVKTLVNEMKTAGYYKVQFNAADLASGAYFYQMQAGEFVAVKKFVVLK
ncbi:MAG: FG-GAP-like repeat-containing protein [Ignavibacteria bacterium]|nr:FG-GAP-like repeat-containing protein [Ignavibacteria bacterium]